MVFSLTTITNESMELGVQNCVLRENINIPEKQVRNTVSKSTITNMATGRKFEVYNCK
jgi:hypothetical protein